MRAYLLALLLFIALCLTTSLHRHAVSWGQATNARVNAQLDCAYAGTTC